MAENPYFHRAPIRDSRFFFGRTAETQRILSYVSRKQSVSVVGPRRIGKTSLLIHLSHPEVKTVYGLGHDCVYVYVDCQALSGDLTESDVYRKLLEDIIEAIRGGHSAEYGSREPMTYLEFEKSLDEIIPPGLQIVFMFDEFEEMATNLQLGKGFFNKLRGLGQAGKVVYVTASGQTLGDLAFHDKSVLSSPFFNIFYPMWLGFMRLEEARALVDGLAAMADFEGFDDSDHAFLQGIAGPHPFYLQVACYHLFEEKVNGAGPDSPGYDLVKREFVREIRDHFQYDWKLLSHDEKRMLKLISEGHSHRVTAEGLEGLEQKCLVYQGEMVSSVFPEFVSDACEFEFVGSESASLSDSGDVGTRSAYHAIHLAWKISGALLLLVLLLGTLLVWQAPNFVLRSALSLWNALTVLWSVLGQIGDAIGGFVAIVIILSVAATGIKGRKRIRQMVEELWKRLT
jgi:hypothetical protein